MKRTKQYLVAAAAVAVLSPQIANATSATKSVTISLTVNPIILLHVSDNDLVMDTTDMGADYLVDSTNMTRAEGRAEFWVSTNTAFQVSLSSSNVFGGAGDWKIRFDAQSPENAGVYIGGTVFLDTDMTSDTAQPGNSDIVDWDPSSASVNYTNANRGVYRYGIGAIFDPSDWSGANPSDVVQPGGIKSIAPPDTYTSQVTITVSQN